jgi:hypothetical protein
MPDKSQFEARKNIIILRMFVETADHNYIVARLAALNHLHLDFFWNGLHAVEKYLKAILLFNGRSAASQGHNIEWLSQQVLVLHPEMSWGRFVKPNLYLSPPWRDEDISTYITRLNKRGNPNNRYLTDGYTFEMGDLLKLDQLVWQIRRHCRPKTVRGREIDWVKELHVNPKQWELGPFPLEKTIKDIKGKDTLLHSAVCALNEPFAPDIDHNPGSFGFAFKNSPLELYEWYRDLQSEETSPENRELAAQLLEWVIRTIRIPRECQRRTEITSAGRSKNASQLPAHRVEWLAAWMAHLLGRAERSSPEAL